MPEDELLKVFLAKLRLSQKLRLITRVANAISNWNRDQRSGKAGDVAEVTIQQDSNAGLGAGVDGEARQPRRHLAYDLLCLLPIGLELVAALHREAEYL